MPSLNTASDHKKTQRAWWKTRQLEAYSRVRTNSLTSVAQLRVIFSPKQQSVTMEKRVKLSTPGRTSTVTVQRNIDDMLSVLAEKASSKTTKLVTDEDAAREQQQREQQQREQQQREQLQREQLQSEQEVLRGDDCTEGWQQERAGGGAAALATSSVSTAAEPEENMLRLDTLEQQSDLITALSDMEGITAMDNKRGRSSSSEDGIGSPDTKARKLLGRVDHEEGVSRIEQVEKELQEMKDNIASLTGMFGSYMTLLTQNSELMKQPTPAQHHTGCN